MQENFFQYNSRHELEKKCDNLDAEVKNLKIERKDLREEVQQLAVEVTKNTDKLRLAECLSFILMSRPADVEILYRYAEGLRGIVRGERPDIIQRMPLYEKGAKELMADVLSEYLKDELATRQEVVGLAETLREKEIENSDLSDRVVKLDGDNKSLRDENTTLKGKVERLLEEVREWDDRVLKDPSAKFKKKAAHVF